MGDAVRGIEHTFSKMNPLILPLTPSSMTRAQMMKTSATGALEIHVLLPFSVHPSFVLVAVVSMEDGSEPWLGSVRPWESAGTINTGIGSSMSPE